MRKTSESARGGDFPELQKRVRVLLEKQGNPPLSALAKQYGLGHDFIRDIVHTNPRKKSIGSSNLPKLAAALRCDIEYLTLAQDEPRRPKQHPQMAAEVATEIASGGQRIGFGGFLEAGAWRASSEPPRGVEHQLRKLVVPQGLGNDLVAYVMRGDSMAGAGIFDGMFLIAEKRERYAPGDFVVLKRFANGLTELSLRQFQTGMGGKMRLELSPLEGAEPMPEIFAGKSEENIEAALFSAIRVF
jgi:hypothetical protein